MINFNKNSVFNLKPISANEIHEDIQGLLIKDEIIMAGFKKRGREFPVTCIRDESPLLYVYYNYSAKQLIKLQ